MIAARQQVDQTSHVQQIGGTSEEQRDTGACIPALVRRMWSGTDEDKSRAARSLAAVCVSHSSNQQRAADAHAIIALARLLESACSDEAKTQAARALHAVCVSNTNTNNQQRAAPAIPALVRLLLAGGSDETKSEAARALATVCVSHSSQQRAADAHAISALVRLLESSSSDETTAQAAAALSAVCSGHRSNQQRAADAGATPALVRVLLKIVCSDRAKSKAACTLCVSATTATSRRPQTPAPFQPWCSCWRLPAVMRPRHTQPGL